MAFRLFIARGNSQGQQFIAVQPMVFIGREPGCDVVLSDAGVSGRHVRITERDGHYFAEDLKSANGTTLNGSSLGKESEIFTGDSLGVGTAVLQLTVLEAPDLTERKRLVPQGVVVSANRDTGESRPLARPLKDEDDTTMPAGKPLPKEVAVPPRPSAVQRPGGAEPVSGRAAGREAGKPIDRSKYEDDTDKTSPVAPVMADPFMFPAVSPPSFPPGGDPGAARPAGASLAPKLSAPRPKAVPDDVWPTQQAEAIVQSSFGSAGTQKDLAPIVEEKSGPLPPVAPSFQQLKEQATSLVPPVPPAADAMTAIDAAVVEAPAAHQATRIVSTVSSPGHPPSVLVSASDVLRRAPDAANVETQVREPTVMVDDATQARAPSVRLPPPGELASERARKRRQAGNTLGGQLRFYWRELPIQVRAGLGVFALAVALVLWLVFRPPPRPPRPPEPVTLTARPTPFSFGLGDSVDYEHADFKEFRFDIAAPTAVAVMVHYKALDIGKDEVSVSVNDTEAGFVTADMGMPDRELETLLSQFVLKRGEPNVVVFDNVKNPPGKERWRVSDLWLELIPVPELTPEQALAQAKAAYAKAELLEKQRAAGDDTLFYLWRTYRSGWISLLSLREDKRGWMFTEMKRKADAARVELDVQCGTIMLDAKKQMELKNPEAAKEILEGVNRYYPTRDHPCPAIAEQKLREYDL